jgi:transposase
MVQKRLNEAAKKRLSAGRMLQKGKGCAEVALAVGVARQTVCTWKALFDDGGIDALHTVPERDRPGQLLEQGRLKQVGTALLQSPTAHGFGTELWTIKRHALANYCPDNLGELHTTARNMLNSAQKRPSIVAACWQQATLW